MRAAAILGWEHLPSTGEAHAVEVIGRPSACGLDMRAHAEAAWPPARAFDAPRGTCGKCRAIMSSR